MPDPTRRTVLAGTLGLALSPTARALGAEAPLKAAIIGHTGAGSFGHGLDLVFEELPGVTLVAVADADPAGLRKVQRKTGAPRAYADYQEMLEKERPDLVCVAPRWTKEHYAMAKAALLAGAHLYLEKPFTETLEQADELLRIAGEKGLKIAVAHQMRFDPNVLRFHAQREALIGDLLEMRAYGKMDHRAGGEDLVVLGTHLFDLVRLFGGEVESCTARILSKGKPATLADRKRSAKEGIGPLLGDSIYAHLTMDSGVDVTYLTRAGMRPRIGSWGIEFIGTKSTMRLHADIPPSLSLLQRTDPGKTTRTDSWKRWPEVDPYHAEEDGLTGFGAANRRVVKDWLAAIAEDREPGGSGERAMRSLEIIHGIWRAGLSGGRVEFPLENRSHPLGDG